MNTNTTFSEWVDPKIREIGGFSEFCKKLGFSPLMVASWVQGVSIPKYAAQIKICAVLGCSLKDLRLSLGQEYSVFAEYLVRRIVPYGKILDFHRKTGIPPSAYAQWLSGKAVPLSVSTIDNVADALINWGDRTPKRRLVAELIDAVEKSLAARKQRRKIAKDCNSNKIAA